MIEAAKAHDVKEVLDLVKNKGNPNREIDERTPMKEAVLNFDPQKGVQDYADTIVVLLEVEGDPHFEVEVEVEG